MIAPGAAGGATRGPYGDVIRERWRRPRHRGELPGATAVAEDVNPLCGDRVRLMLLIEDGRVTQARFTGDSCAICTAAADLVAEMVTGRSHTAAADLRTAAVLAALEVQIRPTRMQCVALPVTVLHRALGGGAPA